MQEMMQKWMAWMKQLGDKGHIKDMGHPLESTGKLVKGKQKAVTDGPFAETKDVVGGYTLSRPVIWSRRWSFHIGLPDLRRWRFGRSPAGHEDGHVSGARRPSLPARSGTHGRRADADLRRPQPRAGGRRRARRLLPRA